MKPEVFSFINRPIVTEEIFSTERITESVGYIPIKKRLENLVLAGHQLQGFRDGMYDNHEEIDPFRKPGIDFAEVVALSREAGKRMARYQKAVQERKKALQEAQEAKKPASDPVT